MRPVVQTWAEDLMAAFDRSRDEEQIFALVLAEANQLGFAHCAYGLRAPLPLTNPKVVMLDNYPPAWRRRYKEAGYLDIDPLVRHARHSRTPVIWSDALFAEVPTLWAEARSFGLCHGWAQSNLDSHGVGGMLTLSRSTPPLTANELHAKEVRMRWLAHASHLAFSRVLVPRMNQSPETPLTEREIEILRWTADGKTTQETSRILRISIDTVNYHVKSAISKLRSANKTAATVRAAMLGLLG